MLATRLVGATSVASTLPTITWIGATSIGGTTSSFTFSGVDIGTPSPSRLVIVGASAYNSATRRLSSVTIAGNSTTAHIGTSTSASFAGGIVSRADSTNSTADIVVNFNGTCTQCAIFVWVATNLDSNTPIEALTDSGTFSLGLDVEEDGPYVALVRAATSKDILWTGITEDVDGVGSSGIFATAASAIATSTTTQTITAGPFGASRGFAVSWR